jgi:hypothetical protein
VQLNNAEIYQCTTSVIILTRLNQRLPTISYHGAASTPNCENKNKIKVPQSKVKWCRMMLVVWDYSLILTTRTPQAEASLNGALCSHITRVDGVPVYFVLFPVKLWALFEEQPRGLRLCHTPTSFLFGFILGTNYCRGILMRNLV